MKVHYADCEVDYSKSPELYEELALTAAQEVISAALEREGITRSELAKRLGRTRAAVTRLLADGRNLTMRSVGRILFHLGEQVQLESVPIHQSSPNTVRQKIPWQVAARPAFRPPETIEYKEPGARENAS